MRVRCGACRTEFEVAGAGRYACPVCGSVNVVRNGGQPPPQTVGGYQAAPGVGGDQAPPPPPPPPPDEPLPHVECPNCSAEVPTGLEVEDNDE